jgi:hypothetical protein
LAAQTAGVSIEGIVTVNDEGEAVPGFRNSADLASILDGFWRSHSHNECRRSLSVHRISFRGVYRLESNLEGFKTIRGNVAVKKPGINVINQQPVHDLAAGCTNVHGRPSPGVRSGLDSDGKLNMKGETENQRILLVDSA